MANHVSAKKRVRQNAKRAKINSANRSRIRTFVKKVEMALVVGDVAGAETALLACQPELQKVLLKGFFLNVRHRVRCRACLPVSKQQNPNN
jgi:small subunit ribosomal protein S20